LPTISITTPSYNQAEYLGATLQSVLRQRRDVYEYLVYDGGSSDGSKEIIEASSAEGITHWVSQRDAGQSDAIRKGFERSTGDILFWLNSDDLLLPKSLRRVREAFARHPEWDVLTGWSVFVDGAGIITRVNCIPGESRDWASKGILHVCQQTCFFRRSLYERVGGIDLGLHCAMDTDLWLKFFEAGARWGHIPCLIGAFRQHALMKGVTWTQRYESERLVVQARHPWFPTGGEGGSLASASYRVRRFLSSLQSRERHLRAMIGSPVESLWGATT